MILQQYQHYRIYLNRPHRTALRTMVENMDSSTIASGEIIEYLEDLAKRAYRAGRQTAEPGTSFELEERPFTQDQINYIHGNALLAAVDSEKFGEFTVELTEMLYNDHFYQGLVAQGADDLSIISSEQF